VGQDARHRLGEGLEVGGRDGTQIGRNLEAGPQRQRLHGLGRGAKQGGPVALEKVSQTLVRRGGGHEQLVAPQPQSRNLDQPFGQIGDVAAPLTGQAGDDRGVGEVRVVLREVLALPGPSHENRVHAHERHLGGPTPIEQRLPAMPCRLAGHHHPREVGPLGHWCRPREHLVDDQGEPLNMGLASTFDS
jgi:hypothetical protein